MTDALIFDSGVGGLSVVAAIRRRLPGARLAYACDNAALPYGTKPDAWLRARIVEVCVSACEVSRPRALVVACNTASTLALEALRARLSIPVIGTVPAIKPAAARSRTRVLGLLATGATIQRPYLDRLIADFAADCEVVRVAADVLVPAAERLLAGGEIDTSLIAAVVAPLWQRGTAEGVVDTVVLGCTHFPLLRTHLAAQAPASVQWVDSGDAIARRLESLLPERMTGVALSAAPSWATEDRASGLRSALSRFDFAAPERLPAVAVPSVPIAPVD
ncbi:glutamate racemase [Salinicola avicenniae]|uniref:glutamate racemase n=1 Tax=Salinicola avicenniae TaxID=2916836 RepID=UPI0020738432|nr:MULTISPECIES: glutamate racemase [unclassified Salinicola]